MAKKRPKQSIEMSQTIIALFFMLVTVALVASFVFGVLVGQGEFEAEQQKISETILYVTEKAKGLLGIKDTNEQAPEEKEGVKIQYQFYKAMLDKNTENPPNPQEKAIRFWLLTNCPPNKDLTNFLSEIKKQGIPVAEVNNTDVNHKRPMLKLGPFHSEEEGRKVRELLLNRYGNVDIKVVR